MPLPTEHVDRTASSGFFSSKGEQSRVEADVDDADYAYLAACVEEQQAGYADMTASLRRAGPGLALLAGAVSSPTSPRAAHLIGVSRAAERLAGVLYQDEFPAERDYWVEVCRLSGLLHEVFLYTAPSLTLFPGRVQALTYEDLVDRADLETARAVGALTPDRSLPRPVRLERLANAVGLGGKSAQLVKLADLLHDALNLHAACRTEDPKTRPAGLMTTVQEFLEEASLCRGAMHDINRSPWLAKYQPQKDYSGNVFELLDDQIKALSRCLARSRVRPHKSQK